MSTSVPAPAALYVPSRPVAARRAVWDPAVLVACGATALLLGQLACSTRLLPFDAWAHAATVAIPVGQAAARRLRLFASFAAYYGALLVLLAAVVAWRRGASASEIARTLVLLGVGMVVASELKWLCWRARPVSPLDGVQWDSFPSGHTAGLGLCVATALHLLVRRSRPRDRWWWGIALAGVTTTLAVGFVRVQLQRHWATDVTAGLWIATAFWGVADHPRGARGWIALALGLGVLASVGAHVTLPSADARVWHAQDGRRRLGAVPKTPLQSDGVPL